MSTDEPTEPKPSQPVPKSVMSFGGGVQSTAILTLAGEGHIPMPDRWVFSDPGFESELTYAHLERCKEYLSKKGGKLDVVTAGNIREDAVTFAERRRNSDVKRYASIPMFIKKRDGRDGILPRQCTSEYKIEPIERYHRRTVLGLAPRQRAPKAVAVSVWIGISADETRRATPPGRWRKIEVPTGEVSFWDNEPITKAGQEWVPTPWQEKVFPMLGYRLLPDRTKVMAPEFEFCYDWDRDDAKNWNAKAWPHPVPRSACVCCPYRTNSEWREMRDQSPKEWGQAVEFDRVIRQAYATDQAARGELAGVPYLHRSLIPLDMVDLGVPMNDRMGCGGLFSQEPDGICGV